MTRALIIGLSVFLMASGRAVAQGAGQGTIKGRVVWAEKGLPERQPIDVQVDKVHCLSKGKLFKDEWIIHAKSKGLRYVCVYLAPIEKDAKLPVPEALKKPPATKVEMDQPCCKFVPRSVALREGQTLLVKNSSPVTHNYRYLGDQKNNLGASLNMKAGTNLEIKGLNAQSAPLQVNCDMHKWMYGSIFVFNHPYFAMTDENGNFEIKNAPAGTWQLVFRHESGRWNAGDAKQSRVRVTVPAGKEATVNVDWKAPPP
jgi:hypothetical protein